MAAKKKFIYAYTWVLQLWLRKQGIIVLSGVFSRNVVGPGTGRRPSKEKLEFGERAWKLQIELIVGGDAEGLSDLELAARARKVWAAAPSYKASEIAKKLLTRKYDVGGAEREAARKYVADAIALVKPTPEAFIEKHLAGEDRKNLLDILDMIMGAKPPFD